MKIGAILLNSHMSAFLEALDELPGLELKMCSMYDLEDLDYRQKFLRYLRQEADGLILSPATNKISQRVEVIKRRAAFEEDGAAFATKWEPEQSRLRDKITTAQKRLPAVDAADDILYQIADTAIRIGVDGHRADLVMLKAAKALAAWYGCDRVEPKHVEEIVELALMHRMRRKPFQAVGSAQQKLQQFLRGGQAAGSCL